MQFSIRELLSGMKLSLFKSKFDIVLLCQTYRCIRRVIQINKLSRSLQLTGYTRTKFQASKPEHWCLEFVRKLSIADMPIAIAKRHAAMPRAAEFPSTFCLARSFPTHFRTPSFHYSLPLRSSSSFMVPLAHLPTTPTLFPLFSSAPHKARRLLHARNAEAGSAH